MTRPGAARSQRSHHSIGEVLSLLREEYPDVTISKIRFLESQGLLDPERTPSGYRKFYDADINRLRWILQLQKEHYLPLKVIKERLDQPTSDDSPCDDASHQGGQQPLLEAPRHANGHARNGSIGPDRGRHSSTRAHQPSTSNGTLASPSSRPPPWTEMPADGSAVVPDDAANAADADDSDDSDDSGSGGWSLDELCEASGMSSRDIHHLERFGLLEARELGHERVYTSDALVVARVAARFLQHGIEARHMRTYKVAVDREASLFEQIVLPVLKQRNPEARRRAAQTIAELIELGDVLRGTLLRRELRGYLEAKD